MLIEIRLLEKHFNVNLVYKSQFPPLLQNKIKNLYKSDIVYFVNLK